MVQAGIAGNHINTGIKVWHGDVLSWCRTIPALPGRTLSFLLCPGLSYIIIITGNLPFSRMAPLKKTRGKRKKPLIDMLPELLVTALANNHDFIMAFETDPDTGVQNIHVMTGKFSSPCMLRKLVGLVESQRDEGSTMISRKWGLRKRA